MLRHYVVVDGILFRVLGQQRIVFASMLSIMVTSILKLSCVKK